MGKMQKTNLVWDEYVDYLIDAINGSKFMKRAENKPMSTPKTATESHISTRSIHLRESADVAKRLAKGLGLNENYIYTAMLMHDAGHPFSAHEGEEIFSQLGEIDNTQYYHHNAKGVEVIISEDICGKAISKIPNIENNPELRKKLEEEFYYFLDVVISHDGEATKANMMRKETPYNTIREAVETKRRSANSQNNYKFTAQTSEGKIAKFADVIAYLSSDMQDGFRLGILKGFSDNYLELFGEMFSQDYPVTREEKIDCGKRIIEQIKMQNLREIRDTKGFLGKQNKDVQKALSNILDKIKEEKIDIYTGDIVAIQEILDSEKEAFRKARIQQFFEKNGADIPEEIRTGLENKMLEKIKAGIPLDNFEEKFADSLNRINSEATKIDEFGAKMLRVRSSVVYEITSRMKEYFINDLLKNSQNTDTPQFSNAGWDLFFKAKDLNYKEFVQYTNWDYQTTQMPRAALELVEQCANSLVKSGAIRNKFYDEEIISLVTDDKAKEYMRTPYRQEDSYEGYKQRNRIGDINAFSKISKIIFRGSKKERNRKENYRENPKRNIKSLAKPSKCGFKGTKKQQALMKLYSDLYSYVQNEDEVFAMRYQDTFNAIPIRIRRKVELALEPKIEEKVDKEKDSDDLVKTKKHFQKHLYHDELKQQVYTIRRELTEKYGTLDLTEEQISGYVNEQIESELRTMEMKIARQLAKEYLAGMTDRSFVDIAIKTGHLSQEVINKGKRGTILSETVLNLRQDIKKQNKTLTTSKGIKNDEGR